jgi:hypothetical protein
VRVFERFNVYFECWSQFSVISIQDPLDFHSTNPITLHIKVEPLRSLGDRLKRHNQLAIRRSEQIFRFRSISEDFRISKLGISVGDEVDERRPEVGGFGSEDWRVDSRWLRVLVVGDGAGNVESSVAEVDFGAPEVCAVEAENELWPCGWI